MKKLKSTNVIEFRDVEQKGKQVNIVMEYAPGGDLSDEIARRAKQKKYYSESELLDRFADCAKALGKTHQAGVVHRDIKPQNIFLADGGRAKLGDFGIAKSCSKNGRVQTPIGTPLYLDPQRLRGQAYGQKADIWGLGCVLYEMATLEPAFNVSTMHELKQKVAAGKVNMSKLPKHYSPQVKDMITSMIQVPEHKRASVDDILGHPKMAAVVQRRSSNSDKQLDSGQSPQQQAIAANQDNFAPDKLTSRVVFEPRPALSPINRNHEESSTVSKGKDEAVATREPYRGRPRQIQRGPRAKSHSPAARVGLPSRGRPAVSVDSGSVPRPRSLSPGARPSHRGPRGNRPSPLGPDAGRKIIIRDGQEVILEEYGVKRNVGVAKRRHPSQLPPIRTADPWCR